MKRFQTVQSFTGSKKIEYKLPVISKGKYIVDDSHFVPISEAVKQLNNSVFTDTEIKNYFDFSDGKDTGIKVPISRQRKDLAEVATEVFERTIEIKQEIERGKEINRENIEFENNLKNISKKE